jgi:integrase/recombinase XerC
MSQAPTDWIDRFLLNKTNVRRLSPNTIEALRRDLAYFQEFCKQNGLEAWEHIRSPHMRQFVVYAHKSGVSGRSVQRYLSSVRSFFRFLLREGIVQANPVVGIRAPKYEKRLPNALDVDQAQQLLNFDPNDPFAIRDLAIMELLYSSGLRLSELVGLSVADVDMGDATVRVTGKGSKMRVVPVGRIALQALQVWLQQRPQWLKDADEHALFLSRDGNRLHQRSIQTRMRLWGLRQNLPGSVHPHRLRHSFASHLLQSSGDIRAVQELLGHANIGTTQIYTHLDYQHLAQVYDQAHPRAKKSKPVK